MSILYFSFTRLEQSLNVVYIKGLRENGVSVNAFYFPKNQAGSYWKIIRYYWAHRNNCDFVMIGYESSELVILLRLISRKKIIFNAVLPICDRQIISRALVKPNSLKGFYYWFLDFLSFNLASLVMFESDQQIKHCHTTFFVPLYKCFKAYIGVDSSKFYYDSTIEKSKQFTVVFRGRFLPEAGAEYAIQAAKLLEKYDVQFIVAGNGQELSKVKEVIEKLKPNNLKLVTDFLSDDMLRQVMQSSHLTLGQLSDHPRLQRTIPHKIYESLSMKLPYLTPANNGILELLTPDETCLICKSADPQSLADKILWTKNNYQVVQKIAENGYQLYKKEFHSSILARNFLNKIQQL